MGGAEVTARSHKDVAREGRVLQSLGFQHLGHDGTDHHIFDHPKHGSLRIPGSPSNPRWIPAHRQKLARMMGMSKPDLERLLGERPPKRKGEKSRKVKQTIRRSFTPPLSEPEPIMPEALGIPTEDSDPITPERRAEWERNQRENERARAEVEYPWK